MYRIFKGGIQKEKWNTRNNMINFLLKKELKYVLMKIESIVLIGLKKTSHVSMKMRMANQ